MTTEKKARLEIDFPSRHALLLFVQEMRDAGLAPPEAAPFSRDGFDDLKGSGITKSNSFILRRRGERPERFELTEDEPEVERRYSR